jgi:DegV family protein with EDD domain
MADTVAVITDSISCLPKNLIEQYGITIVPIRLLVKGKSYRDSVDITPTEAYRMLEENPESFSTSPSSPGHFLEAYRQASEKANYIFCTTLSSKLSTGYTMARIAMEKAKTELPGTVIHVMDSCSVTAAEGFIALAAARAAEKGGTLENAVQAARTVQSKVSFYALLETIRHVYRTGRIPKIASQIGSALNIKPILTGADGLVRFKGIVGSKPKGTEKLLHIMKEDMKDRPAHIGIMHACVPDEAEAMKQQAAAVFNCAELWISEFTPVMGYATGTGTLAVAYYAD